MQLQTSSVRPGFESTLAQVRNHPRKPSQGFQHPGTHLRAFNTSRTLHRQTHAFQQQGISAPSMNLLTQRIDPQHSLVLAICLLLMQFNRLTLPVCFSNIRLPRQGPAGSFSAHSASLTKPSAARIPGVRFRSLIRA